MHTWDQLFLSFSFTKDAYPTTYAFKIYLGLMSFQLLIAFLMPGKAQKGLS